MCSTAGKGWLVGIALGFQTKKDLERERGGERVNKEAEIDWFKRGWLSPFWDEEGSQYWENGHKCALFP